MLPGLWVRGFVIDRHLIVKEMRISSGRLGVVIVRWPRRMIAVRRRVFCFVNIISGDARFGPLRRVAFGAAIVATATHAWAPKKAL